MYYQFQTNIYRRTVLIEKITAWDYIDRYHKRIWLDRYGELKKVQNNIDPNPWFNPSHWTGGTFMSVSYSSSDKVEENYKYDIVEKKMSRKIYADVIMILISLNEKRRNEIRKIFLTKNKTGIFERSIL